MTTQCSKYLNRIKNNFSHFQFSPLAFLVPLQWKVRGKSSSISTAMKQKWWFRIISNKHSTSNKYFRFLLNQNDVELHENHQSGDFYIQNDLQKADEYRHFTFFFFPKSIVLKVLIKLSSWTSSSSYRLKIRTVSLMWVWWLFG